MFDNISHCLPFFLSTSISNRLSVLCIRVYLCLRLYVFELFISSSVCVSVCWSLKVSVYMSVSLSIRISPNKCGAL
jgi:hypothetical protein